MVVLWLGVREVVARRLTAGELLVFVTYFRALSSPLRQLAKLSTITARGTASAERVLEILNTVPDVQDLPHAQPAVSFRGDIQFDSVFSDTSLRTWYCTMSPFSYPQAALLH